MIYNLFVPVLLMYHLKMCIALSYLDGSVKNLRWNFCIKTHVFENFKWLFVLYFKNNAQLSIF